MRSILSNNISNVKIKKSPEEIVNEKLPIISTRSNSASEMGQLYEEVGLLL